MNIFFVLYFFFRCCYLPYLCRFCRLGCECFGLSFPRCFVFRLSIFWVFSRFFCYSSIFRFCFCFIVPIYFFVYRFLFLFFLFFTRAHNYLISLFHHRTCCVWVGSRFSRFVLFPAGMYPEIGFNVRTTVVTDL